MGWHRDRPQYGAIVGVSLLSDCHFKLRRRAGQRWLRTDWEHDLPPASVIR